MSRDRLAIEHEPQAMTLEPLARSFQPLRAIERGEGSRALALDGCVTLIPVSKRPEIHEDSNPLILIATETAPL